MVAFGAHKGPIEFRALVANLVITGFNIDKRIRQIKTQLMWIWSDCMSAKFLSSVFPTL